MKGITLIELMLSLLATTLVLSSLLSFYWITQKNHNEQTTLMNMQENIHVAVQLLSSAIRTAGYIGCAKLSNDFPIMNYPPYTLAKNEIIKSDLHSLTIKQANTINTALIKTMSDPMILYATSEPNFKKGDILLISNCKSAEIFAVKQIVQKNNMQIIQTENPLHELYNQQAEISRFAINTYFIDKTERLDANGKPVYALFVKDIHARKTELIEGVNFMQIESDNSGVSIQLNFVSLNHVPLNQQVYIYAALRE